MWESHKDRIMSLGTMVSEDNEVYPVKFSPEYSKCFADILSHFSCAKLAWRGKFMVWE